MSDRAKILAFLLVAFLLSVSACTPTPAATPLPSPTLFPTNTPIPTSTPVPSATATETAVFIVETPTPTPPSPSPTLPEDDELCDNDYFPSDDGATWIFAGNNSKTGEYTRTDTVIDSSDTGFTIQTDLEDVSYTQAFECTEAGLINLEAGLQDIVAVFSGKNGDVVLTRENNSGLSIPRELNPGLTWEQFLAWKASSSVGITTGSFTYHYTAMGLEVVSVPGGTFDAMRINVQIEVAASQSPAWTYVNSIWLVKDIGLVKSQGSSDLSGVEFTDTIELVSYDSP